METKTTNQPAPSAKQIGWTDIVIEPNPGRPRLVSRAIRWFARRSVSIQRLVRNDFTVPDRELGIVGRRVVLRKTADDRRHALRRQLVDY
jgi:hypothetical protein